MYPISPEWVQMFCPKIFRSIDAKGTAALELGLLTPLLVLILVSVVEIGRGAYEAMQVRYAVEAGMQYAANNDYNAAGIMTAVTSASSAVGMTATPAPTQFCGCPGTNGITPIACTSYCSSGTPGTAPSDPPGTYIQINATLPHTEILALPGMPTSFTATAIIRK